MSSQRFNPASSPLSFSALNLQYVSSSKYEGDWPSAPHSHQCTELFYVVAGSGQFQIEQQHFTVQANDLIIINPNVLHTETADSGNPMEYMVIGLEGADFLGNEDNQDLRYCFFPCGNLGGQILSYMQEILLELKNNAPYAQNIAQGLLHVLVAKIQRKKEISLETSADKGEKTTFEMAQVKRYIELHFKEDLSLDTLASIAHLNKFYLSHSFKRDFGISPINYLIYLRLRESKFLLADTDYSIAQISHFLGFSSPSYFSQRFKNQEGISPRDYRQNMYPSL
ncbi:MAG: AraC family transcriptional regulator [Clostridiales bacterium]|nr:AraC family transcriptional regulator [Clostridiales bacterium]